MKFNLDFLKFSDKKSKRSKKSGIERKLKKEVDETFTWKNIWKHFALFCMFFGFILKNLPVIHKIPLPFLGSVGGLGSLIFLVSALYLAYKHRDVVTIIFAMLKFFVIALISLMFMLLTGGIYYFFRRSKIDKDIRQGLDITGLPKNMSGGGRRQKFSGRRKQKGGATSENSSELQQDRNAQNKQLKKKVDGLISLIPVNILSELSKDYKKRLLTFALVYVLSLNYFVIYKNYSTPTKVGKLNKEENESFWAGVRGFAFGLFISFMLTFRMLMKQKGDDILKKMKKLAEYSLMFSLITGLSSASTKYLVNGPLAFLFKVV